ncbi:uncharacterized protein LOC134775277 isoform X2 [Penaeus indicus]|uniref:uncharacterized protein LOC134775277 isoform X2 n=1 Tax=Penaeus indicus TaxID=29960 RepID=UPI00300D7973
MSDLRLLLLVGLLSLSPGQGEGFNITYPIHCSGYRVQGTYFPPKGTNMTLLTLEIKNTDQVLYVGPKGNGPSKILLMFGGKSESVNLTTQLQIDLRKDGVRFVTPEKRKSYFKMQSNSTLVLSIECPSISQTSGPPEDVAHTSPSSISAVDGDKSSKTFLDTTAGKD